jgi:MEMO1 family protein
MDKPRIRWIDAVPIVHEGADAILLRDTEGITDQSLVVSKHTAFLLSLMDGTRTLVEIQAEYMRVFGEIVHVDRIREIVEALDSNFFLMSENFLRHFDHMKDEYAKAPVRTSCLAGRSYPDDMNELLAYLDEMLFIAGDSGARGEVAGLLAPHIDYGRGKEVYRSVYHCLKGVESPLIVLFGTSHNYTEQLWNISTKDFATPLGVVPASAGLCDLIRENRELKGCINEWPHRNEHSIELQLPIIQFLAARGRAEILPILTGSMHPYITGEKDLGEEEMTAPLRNLREVLKAYGRPYIVIAGADLAHIGAQFGDREPLDRETLERSRQRDEAILTHVKNVDPEGFFEEVRTEGDRRRICGLTSIYIQLSLLKGGSGEIVDYGQWYDGRSSVSFAGATFRAPVGC